MRAKLFGMWIVTALASCATDQGTMGTISPGVLEVQSRTNVVAPPTAEPGQTFVVSITTYGSSCIEPESTDITCTTNGATIDVFDRRPSGICTADLAPHLHDATLSFDSAGQRIATVRGWDSSHHDLELPITIVIE